VLNYAREPRYRCRTALWVDCLLTPLFRVKGKERTVFVLAYWCRVQDLLLLSMLTYCPEYI